MVSAAPGRARGFTLVEMMWTLLVMMVLAAVAAPSVQEMSARQRLRQATGDLVNSLMRARSTAIKMERNVTMRPNAGGTEWKQGWKIEHPDAAKPVLFEQTPYKAVSITGPSNVVYQFSGRAPGAAGAAWEVTVPGSDQVRCVELELNGLPSQKPEACS
jgi:type IV fimbrial biogenesis protein FimT